MDKDLLLGLFRICNHDGCGCIVDSDDVNVTTVGAALIITATCANSHAFKWCSSPKIGQGKRQMFVVNIVIACYVLLCGLNIDRVLIKL